MTNATSSSSAPNDPSASTPHLICHFRTRRDENDANVGKETTSGKAPLFRETGKKSSYLLQSQKAKSPENIDAKDDGIDWYSIPKPAHLVVEHEKNPTVTTESLQERTFFFGGLQLVFDAKNIEIYLTSPGGEESYLMTCKGIPYKMNEKENVSEESKSIQPKVVEWRRALCVVPGGPRCISCLRIKLIGSTSTSDNTNTKVRYMKLTARIVDPSPSSTGTSAQKSPVATTNPQQPGKNLRSFNPSMFAPTTTAKDATSNSEPPLTQKDLGAAMAGLSFMARKTEEQMADLFKQQSKKIENNLESYFARMESQLRALNPTLTFQHQLIKENQTILKEQQKVIDHQTTQINKLLNDNQDLQVRVQSLQADISILRSQESYSNARKANECSNENDTIISEKKVTAKHPPSELDADDSPSAPLDTEEKTIKMENDRLRNVLQNVARDIDEEPILRGCGGTAMVPPSAALVTGKKNIKLENAHLRNVIQNVSRGIDEEPLLKGCGGTDAMYPEKADVKAAKEIEEIVQNSGCGFLLHGIEAEITRKIDSTISSRMKPSAVSLDTTRSIKNIQKKYCEELYNNTPNIEVTLMEEEQIKEENYNGKVSVDEGMGD